MIIVIFILLMLLGAPIAAAIGLSSFIAMFQGNISIDTFGRTMFSGIDSFTLMAIPFFVFAGDLMLAGGTSKRLIDLAKKLVGWTTGGLPIAGVLSSMVFAALSGSSPATVAAIGSIMIPSLKDAGYSPRFAVGLMCAAGSLGIIIPPSITLLVYGAIAEVSISKLFIAGIIPGIFIGIVLMVVSYIIAKKQGHQPDKRVSLKELWIAAKGAIWGIMMPVIILGGIYKGYFTPTEAAAVAIVYSLLIGFFVYKELSIKKLFTVTKRSVVTSAMIMFIIASAKTFSWYLTYEQLPTKLASNIMEFATTPFIFLIIVTIVLLLVGMFMDSSAAVLILVPLFLPIVIEMGIDPIHFGVIMIINLAIGMLTPPFGLNLYVASGISNMSVTSVTRGAIPFIIVLIITLLVLTFIPQISLFLPEKFM
ncbi:TRAP transporter large permease [Lederbergia lenta]|uniref:C4-dicarboxylate transporter permease large protein n=1 Tax=Lederbergia lenta TaxID=1467 RepID=A0A2X4WE75_LEDLE|nr:TRAP transporter large permease [Lederbergia lenta]MCM3109378.1 TRAP transporter large permease [Lederbergia lenta]MEC2324857.1 TRAP transporter large permease [Lederbergia lenta]SQI57142.1 C4-dicarboxylate transporter permease large protein [Lederbergia lenta]